VTTRKNCPEKRDQEAQICGVGYGNNSGLRPGESLRAGKRIPIERGNGIFSDAGGGSTYPFCWRNFNNYSEFYQKFQRHNFKQGVQEVPLFTQEPGSHRAGRRSIWRRPQANAAEQEDAVSAEVRQKRDICGSDPSKGIGAAGTATCAAEYCVAARSNSPWAK